MSLFRYYCGAAGLLGIAVVLLGGASAQQREPNDCLKDGRCHGGSGTLDLRDCGLTADDLDDISDCFDIFGRERLKILYLGKRFDDGVSNDLSDIPDTFLKGMDDVEYFWETSRTLSAETDSFVRTAQGQACDERWTSWPAVQASGLASGDVLMFKIMPSIGNTFISLAHMMKVALLLEVALVLDCERFPGFPVAFDPSEIKWDSDPSAVRQRANDVTAGDDASGLHAFKYDDGVLLLSDSRLLLMATKLDVLRDTIAETATAVRGLNFTLLRRLAPAIAVDSARPDTCAWNLLLKRSSSMVESMAAHSPWITTDGTALDEARLTNYVAWHIRTSDGESRRSFKPDVHLYVFDKQDSGSIFPLFFDATQSAEEECQSAFPGGSHDTPIYISSNSNVMARNCSIHVAEEGALPGYVDLGVSDENAHTAHSKDPKTTAVNAFIDYLFLMDADLIVRSGSSFSGTVVDVKGLKCHAALPGVEMPVSGIFVCLPNDC